MIICYFLLFGLNLVLARKYASALMLCPAVLSVFDAFLIRQYTGSLVVVPLLSCVILTVGCGILALRKVAAKAKQSQKVVRVAPKAAKRA